MDKANEGNHISRPLQPQNELAESLIRSSIDGILAFDRECRYTIWNPGMERISGIKKEDALGRVAFELFPFLKETGEDKFFLQALSGKTAVATDRPFEVPTTGRKGYFEAHYSPLYGRSGQIIGGLAIVHDATKRHQTEQALRESEHKYRMVVEQASDGIAIYDRQGSILAVNEQACKLIGYTRDELLGMNVVDVITPEDLAATPLRWEALSSGQPMLGERVLLRKDGTPLPVELSARLLSDGTVQTILRDITERQQSGEAIRQLNAELEQRVEARTAQLEAANQALQKEITERKRLETQKDEFIAVASHELRTPITVVKGYTKMALKAAGQLGDERLVRTLRIVDEKADQLTRLISEMLDVSRIENGRLALERQRMDLAPLVREAAGGMRLTSPDFTIATDVQQEPIFVDADPQRIEQVLANLVDNAVKYTGNDTGNEKKIEIHVHRRGGEAVTSVRDYGVGIPDDQQKQVFGRFFRAKNVAAARYPYPGMGLGLFVSHTIVTMHGGRMWVESKEGKGSTFYFSLPLAREG